MLRRLGATIVDADELAREIVKPGQEAWAEIVEAFGAGILRQDKTIDRQKLRKIVFTDKTARNRLEWIMHPRIRALAEERMQKLASEGADIIVYEAPLLFENKVHLWLRPVILVSSDAETQKHRLQERDKLSEAEILQHVNAQMPLEKKKKLADFVIENNGDLEELRKRVYEVWEKIQETENLRQ